MNIHLPKYAAFICENRLDAFVHRQLEILENYDLPMMAFFRHLTPEELFEVSKAGVEKLMIGLETGTAIDEARTNLDNWKNDRVPGIPRKAISLKDITLVYSIQKMAFLSFVTDYTSDPDAVMTLITELELHYINVQEMALEMYEAIRQEEQEKRMESEARFKDLFDNSNDLIQFLNIDGIIVYVNQAWEKTMGYAQEEVTGQNIFEFVDKEEVENYRATRQKLLSGEADNFFLRTCYVSKGGRNITLEGYISARRKEGKIEFTRAVLRDVTERTQQEKQIKLINEQLAEREENLRHLVQHAPDAVIVINTENCIRLWNNKAEQMFGYTAEEVLEKDLTDIIIPERLRAAHRQGLFHYVETEQKQMLNGTAIMNAVHKDGHELTISVAISSSRQEGGQIFISFLRDITVQRKNELELENKQRQLEKTNKELEQYAWLTSHDLKEPVRKILTYSDALMTRSKQQLPPADYNFLQKISNSARRMNALIDAVLQYSNVTNEASLFAPTDLSVVVKEVLDDLEIMISSSRAEVIVDQLPVVEAIPIQMRQLFQNLITNAIKYRRPEVPLIIRLSCEPVENGYKLRVADNGIGFDNAYTHKIFQVFQRLLTQQSHEGTGIGLALCKKILDTHNGSIQAESEPGVGSTFTIFLPAINGVSQQA